MSNRNRKSIYFFICLLSVIFCSCKPKKHYYEQKDSDLIIQVSSGSAVTDTGGIHLSVRILPGKTWLQQGIGRDKSKFYYGSDSCFYLRSPKGKTYAAMVEPIANGVSSSIEYLLDFELQAGKEDSVYFIYQDKYINKKKYSIKLN